jgi:hypothetical protein
VLLEELKKAAENTESISSVPAFLATHLRRCFAQKQKTVKGEATRNASRRLNLAAQSGAVPQQDARKQERESTGTASKDSLEECRRYAKHLQKTGEGITNPGGYATTIYRTGEADSLIEKFLNPESAQDIDSTRCPDCRGMGFFYPEGIDRSVVAKCRHPRLETAIRIEEQINQLRHLHIGDASYQESDLLDDLRFRCEQEVIPWEEDVVNQLLDASPV